LAETIRELKEELAEMRAQREAAPAGGTPTAMAGTGAQPPVIFNVNRGYKEELMESSI